LRRHAKSAFKPIVGSSKRSVSRMSAFSPKRPFSNSIVPAC
jgi:hypothetical protein